MKIPVIKNIVESYSIEELQSAEVALLEEQKPEIEIEGEDEGEQLTHVIAALWVKNHLNENPDQDIRKAVREYTVKVRNSIN
jgi:hypothetical protein